MEDNKTTQSAPTPASPSPQDWRDRYPYRHRFWLPVLVILIVIVGFGLMAGSVFRHRPGQFGFVKEERFENRFPNKPTGMMGGQFGRGRIGAITAISGSTLTVHRSSGDLTVTVADTTSIYSATGSVDKLTDLKVGDVISVSGAPGSNGQITAQVIRVF